jgi:hypothetical protein
VHVVKDAPSSAHLNPEPDSDDVNVKVADVRFVVAGGLPVIVVSGAVVSIVHVRLAGLGSTLPAASVALTWKVWLVAARPVYVRPLVQEVNVAVSSAHWKVEPDSVDVNVNVAPVAFVGFVGLPVIVVSGACVSIIHVQVVAGPVLPAVSIASTANV